MEKKRYIHPTIAVFRMNTTSMLCSSEYDYIRSVDDNDNDLDYGGAGGEEEAR